MTHDEFQEQTSQLIDGELGEELQPTLFAHLSTCEECRRFLNSTLALHSNLTSHLTPVPQSLDQRLLGTHSTPIVYHLDAKPAAFRLALAASIAFILLMGSLLFSPQVLRTGTGEQPGGIVSTAPGAQPFSVPQQY